MYYCYYICIYITLKQYYLINDQINSRQQIFSLKGEQQWNFVHRLVILIFIQKSLLLCRFSNKLISLHHNTVNLFMATDNCIISATLYCGINNMRSSLAVTREYCYLQEQSGNLAIKNCKHKQTDKICGDVIFRRLAALKLC